MTTLEVKDLIKEFKDGTRANDGISLNVEAGEVFGLLGPNGAGKTTLVNQIIALLKPTSGTISINGTDIESHLDYARTACSFQPQSDVPIDGFTPTQAIELIGRLRGGDRFSVKKRTTELIDALQIGKWEKTPGMQLSGGVRRLVGYAMAAVSPPDIVILDEPTNDVDPLRRRLLWKEIRRLSDTGTSVLLITHNVLEAERAVDKLAIIDQGRVQCSGTPASLKSKEAGKLRLDVKFEPDAKLPNLPFFIDDDLTGRRLQTTIDMNQATMAVEWANYLQSQKMVEEYFLSPASLEDVYIRLTGRSGESNNSDVNDQNQLIG